MIKRPQGVLVTRPEAQSKELIVALEAKNLFVAHYPMLKIVAEPVDMQIARQYCQQADIFIFTSQNSAHYLDESLWQILQQRQKNCAYYAVGKKTAAAVEKYKIAKAYYPPQPNTESLLEFMPLSSWQNKRVVIIGGINPRPLLAASLRQNGGVVDFIACYRRVTPSMVAWEQWQSWAKQIDTIILTSQQAALNMFSVLPMANRWLMHCTFVVSSERIAEVLRERIIDCKIKIAQSAYVDDIISAVNV